MGQHITSSTRIKSAGNQPKLIEEFIGLVNSKTDAISIAKMKSPKGWVEPGQTPEFDEYTVVLSGSLLVNTKHDEYDVCEGEAFIAHAEEWVQYSSPYEDCEYIAVCIPAFSSDTVNRDK